MELEGLQLVERYKIYLGMGTKIKKVHDGSYCNSGHHLATSAVYKLVLTMYLRLTEQQTETLVYIGDCRFFPSLSL